jgi:serine/threonine protein kinase
MVKSALFLAPPLDDWEMSREKIVLTGELGKGAFGVVLKGLVTFSGEENENGIRLSGHTVTAAIKKMARRFLTEQDHRDFQDEMSVMKSLSSPGHENASLAIHIIFIYFHIRIDLCTKNIFLLQRLSRYMEFARKRNPSSLYPSLSPKVLAQ